MIFREARTSDIEQLMSVRMSVKENVLSNPGLVTEKDCEEYLTIHGKGWVCEIDHDIVGFSIVGLTQHNIWALFVRPEHEGRGIGKRLHDIMLDWYFNQTKEKVWLGTSPNSRAEVFYRRAGWKDAGKRPNGEIQFELTIADWQTSLLTNTNEKNKKRR